MNIIGIFRTINSYVGIACPISIYIVDTQKATTI